MAEMRIDILRDQLANVQAHVSPLASTVAALVAERDRLVAVNAELVAALEKEREWRDREAAGALDEDWDYETMVGQYRRAALAKSAP